MKKKSFSLGEIPSAVIILVIIGALAGIGTSINDSMLASTTDSTHFNATLNNASDGLLEITSNLELLGLIIIMGAVITILLMSFGGFMRGGGL